MENQIRAINIKLLPSTTGGWLVTVTKEFAPEHGGGIQDFTETAPNMHRALDVARSMVTFSPGARTDLDTAPASRVPDWEPQHPERVDRNPATCPHSVAYHSGYKCLWCRAVSPHYCGPVD